MRRIITVIALAATMLLASASMAIAGGPNEGAICIDDTSNAGYGNHGAHITVHYVGDPTDDGPGVRGRAAHFGDNGFKPGASFCQGTNSAPSLLGDPGRF